MTTDMQSIQSYNERLNDVKQYIREHINEPLNRDVLAAVAGFSVPHFHRIFTTHMGENISDYVRRVRLAGCRRENFQPTFALYLHLKWGINGKFCPIIRSK